MSPLQPPRQTNLIIPAGKWGCVGRPTLLAASTTAAICFRPTEHPALRPHVILQTRPHPLARAKTRPSNSHRQEAPFTD